MRLDQTATPFPCRARRLHGVSEPIRHAAAAAAVSVGVRRQPFRSQPDGDGHDGGRGVGGALRRPAGGRVGQTSCDCRRRLHAGCRDDCGVHGHDAQSGDRVAFCPGIGDARGIRGDRRLHPRSLGSVEGRAGNSRIRDRHGNRRIRGPRHVRRHGVLVRMAGELHRCRRDEPGVRDGPVVRSLRRPDAVGNQQRSASRPIPDRAPHEPRTRGTPTRRASACCSPRSRCSHATTFHLADAPFGLSTAALGWLFAVYLAGAAITPISGRWIDVHGHRTALFAAIAIGVTGSLLTLADMLWLVVAGLALVSSECWSLRRQPAAMWGPPPPRSGSGRRVGAMLSYAGGSVGGALPSLFWTSGGWPAAWRSWWAFSC